MDRMKQLNLQLIMLSDFLESNRSMESVSTSSFNAEKERSKDLKIRGEACFNAVKEKGTQATRKIAFTVVYQQNCHHLHKFMAISM